MLVSEGSVPLLRLDSLHWILGVLIVSTILMWYCRGLDIEVPEDTVETSRFQPKGYDRISHTTGAATKDGSKSLSDVLRPRILYGAVR